MPLRVKLCFSATDNFEGTVSGVTTQGFTFQYQLSNPVMNGHTNWMILLEDTPIPSIIDIREGSSGHCDGGQPQSIDSVSTYVTCLLDENLKHVFWVAIDLVGDGTSASVMQLNINVRNFSL